MRIESLSLWVAETNAWIVIPDNSSGECVLIDAPPDPAAILARLAEHDLRLAAVISTHGHLDHVGGISTVVHAQPNPTPVHIHDADRHMLVDPVGASAGFAQYLDQSQLDLRPPEIIESLDDGQVVRGAGLVFRALHTPGHTRGSVCLLLDADDGSPVMFSGDHLFAGSIGRTDLPGGSMVDLMESMVDKILPLDDDIQVLP
ncbi:MAG: MBL fold metallo-hydrolase, partial [Acidimicrobiales bacterium]